MFMSFRSVATEQDKLNGASLGRSRTKNLMLQLSINGLIIAFTGYLSYLILGVLGLMLAMTLIPIGIYSAQQFSSEVVLEFYHAVPVHSVHAPTLHAMTDFLRDRAGLPNGIEIFYSPLPTINAFSTGKFQEPKIVLSHGILATLDERELSAVIAHEISHIRNGDLTINMTMQLFSRLLTFLCYASALYFFINLPLIILGYIHVSFPLVIMVGIGPHLVQLLQLKLSRIREYEADRQAVILTQDPLGLINAIHKINHVMDESILAADENNEDEEKREWLHTHPTFENRVKQIHQYVGHNAA